MSNPSDLNIATQPDTDKNYFNFKAAGLKIDTNYAIKFQWVYEDGTVSEWSAGKFINTATENVPAAVTATVPGSAIGNIPVTLSVFPSDTKRVDIYIIGGVYGTGKVADSFFSSGTKNIPVAAGEYQVSLIAVTPSGISGIPTGIFNITISNAVTADTTAPDQITSGIVTGGVNPQFSGGRLGYLNVAVTNSTIPTDFAGYIVKIVSSTNTWTQEFSSPTALSNLYITNGVFVGQAYTLSVATTDGKNISSYVNCTPAPFTVTDTRTNTSTVTGALSFSATDSILTVSWAASTDAYVDSYRVQITSGADTTFANVLQTVESKGTTVSFGGLTSSTTYRIRVTTRYSGSGALSTTDTVGTATLNSSGAISDGIAPTTNPALTLSMVKSFFGAFSISFPAITNADAVTYEIFIKHTDATGIVSSTYKVLEVSGTFAVIRTLADKTTSLSYGTNYYIAIRAKDNDGVSTGTVTPVGPVQTTQVSTQDLADLGITEVKINTSAITEAKIAANAITETKIASDAVTSPKIVAGAILAGKIAAGAITTEKLDALAITADKIAANAITATKILAGEIKAVAIDAGAIVAGKIATDAIVADNIQSGQIDASKMVTDLMFVNKTINVGESTSLNRIRLDSSIAVPVVMTDQQLPSPSTYSVKSRIFIGAGNYYSVGTPFYADNTGRFSLANKLRFNGTDLLINGSGTFSGTVTAGTGPTVSIGTGVQSTNDGIYISGTGDYIYADGRVRLGNGGITYAGGVLTVTGAVTATSIASGTSISGTTGTFTGSITGASGTFGGALDVGTTTLANITGASSVTESSVTRVRFTANNTLKVNDVVTISGIAQNQTFIGWANPPTNTIPLYSYSNNPFNLGVVTVYAATATTFDIQSSVNGTYTSGGTATGSAFKVTSTGIVRAAAGQIGGWDINATQIRSSGTNYISLNPITPGIEIVSPSQGTITINPITGIKDSAGKFTLSPNGNLSLSGSITSGSTITGADITMTGSVNGNGIASTKLLFSASNYAISAGSSSYTYQGTSGSYDENGDWVDASAPQTVTNNDIRFTDATLGGAVPSGTSTFSYGELWLGGGLGSSSTVDLWANYPGGFIGISVAASSSSKNIYIYGDSSAGFDTVHRSSVTDSSKESPAFLQVDSAGRLSRGRAIITGGSSAPSNSLGLTGDLYFSTAT